MPEPIEKVYLAPLAGYTDLPFRRICRRQGCRYAFTAMVDVGALSFGNPRNEMILARGKDEEWLGTQLVGANHEYMAKAAGIIGAMDFDLVDLNLGCPVKKVVVKGGGAALGEQAEESARCLEIIRKNCRHPVSAKIRILHETDPAPTLRLVRLLEEAGARFVTIHGRLREHFYAGAVAAGIIKAVRENVSIPIVANGGIFGWDDACQLAAATGCRQLMVARGSLGNPWIFRELRNPEDAAPSHEEICASLRDHVEDLIDFYGEGVALRQSRKIILAYLVGRGYSRALRAQVTSLSTRAQFLDLFGKIVAAGPTHGLRPGQSRAKPGIELR